MQRILHVLGRTDRGGTESMLMTHYRHIDRTRLQFDFVIHTEDKCDFDDEIESLGGRIYRVRRFNVLNYFQYQSDWKKFFSEHREYRVIHIHHFLVAGVILPIAAKMGVKVRIVHSHNTKPPIFLLKEKVMWLFHKNLIKYSTQRLACSEAAGQYLFGNHSFEVFNNAIETEKFRFDSTARSSIRKELGVEENAFVVGHVGSFRTQQKNHSFIIDVFAAFVKKNPLSRLVLVGTGELQNEIRQKAESLGIAQYCIFTGARGDIPKVLSAFDLFLFPSFFEGLSVVSIEAQASGLPILASTNVTSESKLTDLFVQISLEESAETWAEKIYNTSIPSERGAFVEQVKAMEYDVESNIKKLEKYYGV